MKMKTLATAFAVTMPLVFGTAYAQTTTTPDTGNNRASQGSAMKTNQSGAGSSATDSSAAAGSTAGSGATGAAASGSSNTGATGSGAGNTGASGSGAAGTGAGAAGAMSGAATTGATGADTRAGTQDAATASTEAITGWSAKDDFIGKSVFNENDEKVGDVNDVVISSDGRTLYLLIGAGGFLGMGQKDVAVPFDRFERNDDRVLLSGYTKEQLKALPEVRTQR